MRQFEAGLPWTVPSKVTPVGGHYVPCVGRNSAGQLLVVTWSRLHGMTQDFYARFCDEALAYLSLEMLDAKGLSPEGFDRAGLLAVLAKLSS